MATPEFVPSAQLRARVEAKSWTDTDPDGTLAWVSERARLGLTEREGKVEVKLVVQDVRVWGEELDTLKDSAANAFDLHEGVVTWKPYESLSLAVGRQEIKLEDERLVGSVGWAQQGRSFDAVRFSGTHAKLSYDVIGTVLERRDDTGAGWPENGGAAIVRGGWASDAATIDLLAIGDRDGVADRSRATAGLNAKGAKGALSGHVEAYAQVGTLGDASIAAHLIGVSAAVGPDTALAPKVELLLDRLSGDGDLADGTVGNFDTLWATNHKFYGVADVFGPNDRGLHDAALKASLGKIDAKNVVLEVHGFSYATPRDLDAWIGEEVSVVGSLPIVKGLSAQAGGAVVLRADSADGWGYVMFDGKL